MKTGPICEYVLRCKKGPIKIRENIKKKTAKSLLKKMPNGKELDFEVSITSLEPGGSSEKNGNVQLFFYMNSSCVFFKTIWRGEKISSPMEKGRIEFSITSLETGGNSEPNSNVQIFFYINSNCVLSNAWASGFLDLKFHYLPLFAYFR